MSAWRRARAWSPALVALLGVLAGGWSRLDPVEPPVDAEARRQPEISEDAQELLGGLAVGDQLMGWTVQALDGPVDGVLRIDLGRDRVSFALMVAPLGSRPEPPPVQTERYAIFYGHARPPDVTLPDGTIRATTHALARRIRAHEDDVEVPGL